MCCCAELPPRNKRFLGHSSAVFTLGCMSVAASDSDVNKKCNSNSVREINRNPVMFGNTAAGTAIAAETATMMNMILIAMVVTVVVLVLADMK